MAGVGGELPKSASVLRSRYGEIRVGQHEKQERPAHVEKLSSDREELGLT